MKIANPTTRAPPPQTPAFPTHAVPGMPVAPPSALIRMLGLIISPDSILRTGSDGSRNDSAEARG